MPRPRALLLAVALLLATPVFARAPAAPVHVDASACPLLRTAELDAPLSLELPDRLAAPGAQTTTAPPAPPPMARLLPPPRPDRRLALGVDAVITGLRRSPPHLHGAAYGRHLASSSGSPGRPSWTGLTLGVAFWP